MKIKAIVLAMFLSLAVLVSPVFAQLADNTFGDVTRVQQLTYGPSPVWKVTNISSTSRVVRFTQPGGFTATLLLSAGDSTSLGVFESYYQWSCNAGYTPVVTATGNAPVFADSVAGNATVCRPN